MDSTGNRVSKERLATGKEFTDAESVGGIGGDGGRGEGNGEGESLRGGPVFKSSDGALEERDCLGFVESLTVSARTEENNMVVFELKGGIFW